MFKRSCLRKSEKRWSGRRDSDPGPPAPNDIPADWNFQSSRFKVLMNLHRLDGSPIALDIPLADLPIGRDEDHLYVVDYGAKGRNEPSDRVVLLSYPIPRR